MLKVILSPSKEQSFAAEPIDDMKMLPYLRKTKAIVEKIKTLKPDEMSEIMGIKNNLLEDVYSTYQNFGHTGILPAIQAYTGIAYRQIPVESYSDDELYYLEDHLRILSAMYGILTPLTGMSAYRLDMKMKVLDESLYAYWKSELSSPFEEGETIINLASKEFSKLIKMPMVTVEFKEYKNGKLKTIGTNAKKARGQMVDYMVKQRVKEVDDLKRFCNEDWKFESELSNEKTLVFVRGEAFGQA